MGLKITNEIHTDRGTTSEAYVNISKQTFTKGGTIMPDALEDTFDIHINLYLNENARFEDALATCSSAGLYKYFGYTDDGSPGRLQGLKSTDNAFEFAYALLKESLEGLGYTVIDVN